jgi:DNA-binding response OmpR family regulator
MARIEAVSRRVYGQSPALRSISLCPLQIDAKSREVRLNDRAVSVTAKEFDLLYALASQPERVISRKDLMVQVWDTEEIASSRTIDTHVSSLRAKLGASEWIITVRGVGYRIGYGPNNSKRSSSAHNGSSSTEAPHPLAQRLRHFDLTGLQAPRS